MSEWGEDYDRAAYMDRLLVREGHRLTTGASSLHALDPSEMMMRMEEEAADPAAAVSREREALRVEIFSGYAEYLFADGPEPEQVRARIEGFFQSFQPELLPLRGAMVWVSHEVVGQVIRKHAPRLAALRAASQSRGALSEWYRELRREPDFESVCETIARLIAFTLREGNRWRNVVSVAYCLAKALRPHLIAGMSLEDIAKLSGDSGRATPSDRVRRLYNRVVERAGGKGCQVHFQKSAAVVEKYGQAQLGNQNRRSKSKPRRKRKP